MKGTMRRSNPLGYLKGMASRFKELIPIVVSRILTTDRPVTDVLRSFAQRQEVDLIAVATRADGIWTRWLRESIVDSLVRQTDVPILTLPVDLEHPSPEAATATT